MTEQAVRGTVPRAPRAPAAAPASPWRRAAKQFSRRRVAVTGLAVLLLAVGLSAVAPWLSPHPPNLVDVANPEAPPSWTHPLGTDELGRDIASRLLWGGRNTLLITLGAVALAFAAGSALGIVAGYYGGAGGTVIMRAMDVLLAIPGFLLAVAVIAALGVGMGNVIVAIGINSIPPFARIARGSTLLARQEVYVQAAQALGVSERTIMARHIFPNILSPLIVQSTLRLATAILTASGLSFLGLGVQPPTAEWGAMLSVGRNYITSSPQLVVIPGMAILVVTLAFNVVGDAVRDALDPREL